MNFHNPIIWVNEEALGPLNPALQKYPNAPAIFIFDSEWITKCHISRKRIGFIYECCLEIPVTIRRGDVVTELIRFSNRHAADSLITTQAIDPRIRKQTYEISNQLPLKSMELEEFVKIKRPIPLKRFSRYWKEAEPKVWELFNH